MGKKFQRKIENFVCENCGKEIKGDGYTNHCPFCLSSRHVDINPGDRAASCGGMMYPIGVEESGGKYDIIHKCQKCGIIKKNKMAANDDFEEILDLLRNNFRKVIA